MNNVLQEPEIESTRNLIKYGEKAINASTVAIINLALLKELNKQHNPPSAFPRDRNPSGGHERNEANAVKNIKLFLITKEFVDNYDKTDDKEEFISDFKKRAVEIMGFSAEAGEESFTINFNKFMKDFVGTGESLEWIDKMKEEVRLREGQAFQGSGAQKKNEKLSNIKAALTSYEKDLDVARLESALNGALGTNNIKALTNNFNVFVFSLPANEEKGGDARDVVDENNKWVRNIAGKLEANQGVITENIGKAFNELFDFGYVEHIDSNSGVKDKNAIDEDIETLYKVSARHISYMFNAFGGLKELPQEIRDEVVDSFFAHIVNVGDKNQGWGQVTITSSERQTKPLDASIVKSEATKFVNLNDGNYKLTLNPQANIASSSSRTL